MSDKYSGKNIYKANCKVCHFFPIEFINDYYKDSEELLKTIFDYKIQNNDFNSFIIDLKNDDKHSVFNHLDSISISSLIMYIENVDNVPVYSN